MSQPDTTIEDIDQILFDCIVAVGVRENGTVRDLDTLIIDRQKTTQAFESYINNKVKEARIDENQRWANGYAQVLLDYPDIDEPELFMKAKGDFEDRIKELENS